MQRKFHITAVCFIMLISLHLHASDTRYNENLHSPQNVGGGGAVSPQTGSLSLSFTDIDLPGMNGLDFIVERSYSSVLANIYNMAVFADGSSYTTVHTPMDWKYGLGSGWTFGWPFLFRDIDDTSAIQKLNLFWGGSVYELDQAFSGDKLANNIMYYYVNDLRVYLDSSVQYETGDIVDSTGQLNNLNVRSKYCLALKNGTKYFFSEAGNLMLIRNPYDPSDAKKPEIWFYYKEHRVIRNHDEYAAYRDKNRIELVIDSVGRKLDFIYEAGDEGGLSEIEYSVTVNGGVRARSVKYEHANANGSVLYKIDSSTKKLIALTERIKAGDGKILLTGFVNQMGHVSRYEYRIIEGAFSLLPKMGNSRNFFANLERAYSIYTVADGQPQYKSCVAYEYNCPDGSYRINQRSLGDGFMETFKISREYLRNRNGGIFNDTKYAYYGNSYGKSMSEYWTEVKTGGMKRKYVFGASNIETEDNLLKYLETEGNGGGFTERVDYVYDVRKTLKAKSLYRGGLLKYTEEFIYDRANDLINHKAPNGLVTETRYDETFHVPVYSVQRGVRNGAGKTLTLESENMIRATDGKSLSQTLYMNQGEERRGVKVKKFEYDAYGNLAKVTDARNNSVRTLFDATLHIFPEEVAAEVTIEGVKRTIKGFTIYNSDGFLRIQADNDGYATEHLYDDLGTEIKTVLPDDDDIRGIESAADLLSQAWRQSRSNNGYIENEVNYQQDTVVTYGESFNGKRVKTARVGDGLNHIEKEVLFESDDPGAAEFSVKKMEYDGFGNMIALTDPDAGTGYLNRNVMGKTVQVHDSTWLVWYDDLNRKVKVEYPDKSNKVVRKIFEYNDNDFIVTTTNTRGYKTAEYYDIDGNLIKVVNPGVEDESGQKRDVVYKFEYNQLKKKTGFINPSGEKVSYSFDERMLLTSQDYGDGIEEYSYDDNGNLLSRSDRNGNMVRYAYDELNRNVKQEYFLSGRMDAADETVTLGYDSRGNIISARGKELHEWMSYDARKRVKDIERVYLSGELRADLEQKLDWLTVSGLDEQRLAFHFTYTPNNLVDTMRMPDGKVIKYSYDESKLRLAGIDAFVNGIQNGIVTALEYNRSGQVKRTVYGNGTNQYWEFDARKRIERTWAGSSAGNIFDLNYVIDTEGNILNINENMFAYDELNRLVESSIMKLGETDFRARVKNAFGTSQLEQVVGLNIFDPGADLNSDQVIDEYDHIKACQDWRDRYDREVFGYDFDGNRRTLKQNGKEYQYIYGTQNKLLEVKKDDKTLIKYEYDKNGNTVKRFEFMDNGSTDEYGFEYNVKNQLTGTKRNGALLTRYIYDNTGMRLFKDEGGKRTYYFRNGGTVFYEVEVDDKKTEVTENNYIISGDLIAGRISRKNNGTEEVNFYHLDHLNSTKAVTGSTGNVVLLYEYRAFGSELDKVGSDENRYSYIGREFDEEVNWYYMNARYYDATIGRFINLDPVQDGTNWYVYARNNPLSMKDPTGLWNDMIHQGSAEFGGTYKWANEVGFTPDQAMIIAKADAAVDKGGTAPWPVIGDPSRHFNTNWQTAPAGSSGDSRIVHAEQYLQSAIELQNQANRYRAILDDPNNTELSAGVRQYFEKKIETLEQQALTQLGTGLHSLQDVTAHTEEAVDKIDRAVLGIHHHLGNMWCDDPTVNTEGYRQVQIDTKEYLERFQRATSTGRDKSGGGSFKGGGGSSGGGGATGSF